MTSAMLSPSTAVNNGEMLTVHVMVDADRISHHLLTDIKLFCIRDELDIGVTRQIIGYCVPLKIYEKDFVGAPSLTKLIVPAEGIDDCFIDNFMKRYKFKFRPMFVMPLNTREFQKMLRSEPSSLQNHRILNSSAICIRNDMEPIMMHRKRVWTQLKAVTKFNLNKNPHLVPIRLPNHTECYQLLDLAEHCRDPYDRQAEPEFGHYHFRELQIEDAKALIASAASQTSEGDTPQQAPSCSTATVCSTSAQQERSNSGDPLCNAPMTYAQATKMVKVPKRNASSSIASPQTHHRSDKTEHGGSSALIPQQQSPIELSSTPVSPPLPFSYAQVVTRQSRDRNGRSSF